MTDNARLFGVAGVPSPRHAFKWIPREPRRTASLSRTGCGSAQPKWNQVPRDVRGRSREANKPSTRRTCRRGRPEVVGEWSHEPIVPLARAIRAGTKTDTFDFLRFEHICACSRRGKFTVHVRTMKERLRRSFNGVVEWCYRHDDVSKQHATLNARLRGHHRYYGRPTNYHSLWQFYRCVRCVWKNWVDRRSRGQTPTWETYGQFLRRHPLPRPRITRPWAGAARRT